MHTNVRVKGQWISVCCVVILLVASWIRLYRSNEFLPFWQEQADDLIAVRTMWHTIQSGYWNQLPLKGQSGTYRWSYLASRADNPIYHGVAYYYMLLPAALLSHFEPYGVVLFLITLGIATVYLLYLAGVLLFDSAAVGFVAAGLGATSFWLASYSRWIWTPSTLPFFSVLSLVALLMVLRGKTTWWYVLVFALSLGSQIHDSGYIPLLFAAIILLRYRPRLPAGFVQKASVLFLFIIPMAPTILFEYTSHFEMTRALSGIAVAALPSLFMVGRSFVLFLVDALGVTTMNMSYILSWGDAMVRFPVFYLSVGVVLFVLGYVGMRILGKFQRSRVTPPVSSAYWRLVVFWWVLCIPIPVLVEYLYTDQTINDYSRMNNLAFALPMFFVCAAYGIVYLWQKRVVWVRVLLVGAITSFIAINGLTIHDYLWRYTENDWAYANLTKVARMIPAAADGQPYDAVIYRYNEGSFGDNTVYEMLYFIDLYHLPMPETFNGASYWGTPHMPLRHRPAKQTIMVIDKTYLGLRDLPAGATVVGETQGFILYKIVKKL